MPEIVTESEQNVRRMMEKWIKSWVLSKRWINKIKTKVSSLLHLWYATEMIVLGLVFNK